MLTNYEKALTVRARRLLIEERLPEPEAREQLKTYAARQLAREFDIYDYRRPVELAIERVAAEARRRGIPPTPIATTPPVEAPELRPTVPVVPVRIERPSLTRETIGGDVYYGIAPPPPPPAGPAPAVLAAAKDAADVFRRAVGRARNAPPPEPPPGPPPEVRAEAGRFVRNLKRAETAQRQTR
jgi:hypothetical protein